MFNHTQLSDCCANPTHIILDPHKIFPLYPHYGSFISPNPLLCTFRQRLLRDRRASDFRAGLRRFLAKAGVKSLGVPLGPVKITISKLPWLLEIWPIPVVSHILVMNYGEKHGTYMENEDFHSYVHFPDGKHGGCHSGQPATRKTPRLLLCPSAILLRQQVVLVEPQAAIHNAGCQSCTKKLPIYTTWIHFASLILEYIYTRLHQTPRN